MTLITAHRNPITSSASVQLVARDLGRMAYRPAHELQKRLQQEVIDARAAGGGPMHLLLLEHEPAVITVSRRRGAAGHLLADAGQLEAAGVTVQATDRGGDITYHGPGQLVVYPILDLNALGLRLHEYMRRLEGIVIDLLARFEVSGRRDPAATGVWVRRSDDGAGAAGHDAPRKICALGVRISRWVSMHGLALNVTTRLDHFDLIVPCGLAGRGVTSLQEELGDACPSMEEVKAAMVEEFKQALIAADAQ